MTSSSNRCSPNRRSRNAFDSSESVDKKHHEKLILFLHDTLSNCFTTHSYTVTTTQKVKAIKTQTPPLQTTFINKDDTPHAIDLLIKHPCISNCIQYIHELHTLH